MHVLINSGPTREYIDDVRYLSNESSGQMGYALAASAQRRGWAVTLVSGPVSIPPPPAVKLLMVTSAQEMLEACLQELPAIYGVIAAAAVADYRPRQRFPGKLHRTDESIQLELVPNPDILAEICRQRSHQWVVGFTVESARLLERARGKLIAKGCDAMVANDSSTINRSDTRIQLLDRSGTVAFDFSGPKSLAADHIIDWIATHLAS
jgi:phosphopantothenoylcysteine decarboxylase/phosphopantothenate--cysteine ligase